MDRKTIDFCSSEACVCLAFFSFIHCDIGRRLYHGRTDLHFLSVVIHLKLFRGKNELTGESFLLRTFAWKQARQASMYRIAGTMNMWKTNNFPSNLKAMELLKTGKSRLVQIVIWRKDLFLNTWPFVGREENFLYRKKVIGFRFRFWMIGDRNRAFQMMFVLTVSRRRRRCRYFWSDGWLVCGVALVCFNSFKSHFWCTYRSHQVCIFFLAIAFVLSFHGACFFKNL